MNCCVPGCNSSIEGLKPKFAKNVESVKLHAFPSKTNLRLQWLKNLKMPSNFPNKNCHLVCSKHFEFSSYKMDKDGKRRLKEDALPSLGSNSFNSVSPSVSSPSNHSPVTTKGIRTRGVTCFIPESLKPKSRSSPAGGKRNTPVYVPKPSKSRSVDVKPGKVDKSYLPIVQIEPLDALNTVIKIEPPSDDEFTPEGVSLSNDNVSNEPLPMKIVSVTSSATPSKLPLSPVKSPPPVTPIAEPSVDSRKRIALSPFEDAGALHDDNDEDYVFVEKRKKIQSPAKKKRGAPRKYKIGTTEQTAASSNVNKKNIPVIKTTKASENKETKSPIVQWPWQNKRTIDPFLSSGDSTSDSDYDEDNELSEKNKETPLPKPNSSPHERVSTNNVARLAAKEQAEIKNKMLNFEPNVDEEDDEDDDNDVAEEEEEEYEDVDMDMDDTEEQFSPVSAHRENSSFSKQNPKDVEKHRMHVDKINEILASLQKGPVKAPPPPPPPPPPPVIPLVPKTVDLKVPLDVSGTTADTISSKYKTLLLMHHNLRKEHEVMKMNYAKIQKSVAEYRKTNVKALQKSKDEMRRALMKAKDELMKAKSGRKVKEVIRKIPIAPQHPSPAEVITELVDELVALNDRRNCEYVMLFCTTLYACSPDLFNELRYTFDLPPELRIERFLESNYGSKFLAPAVLKRKRASKASGARIINLGSAPSGRNKTSIKTGLDISKVGECDKEDERKTIGEKMEEDALAWLAYNEGVGGGSDGEDNENSSIEGGRITPLPPPSPDHKSTDIIALGGSDNSSQVQQFMILGESEDGMVSQLVGDDITTTTIIVKTVETNDMDRIVSVQELVRDENQVDVPQTIRIEAASEEVLASGGTIVSTLEVDADGNIINTYNHSENINMTGANVTENDSTATVEYVTTEVVMDGISEDQAEHKVHIKGDKESSHDGSQTVSDDGEESNGGATNVEKTVSEKNNHQTTTTVQTTTATEENVVYTDANGFFSIS